MKHSLLVLFTLIGLNAHAQNFDYSTIVDKRLLITVKSESVTDYIKSFSIDTPSRFSCTSIPVISTSFSFFNWYPISRSQVLVLGSQGQTKRSFTIERFDLNLLDSVTISRSDTAYAKQIKSLNIENWENVLSDSLRRRYQRTTLFSVTPVRDWWQLTNYNGALRDLRSLQQEPDYFLNHKINDFDFQFDFNEKQFLFYIRTPRDFFLWKYTGGIKKDTLFQDWQFKSFFSIDSICYLPSSNNLLKYLGNPLLPSPRKFLPCTITDTAFFRGHNKAIQQGNQHWLINTSHGAIYYLADYGVVKVAQIENFQNYPAALLQRQLFIEDRDKGELIFFSRLIRTDREAPLPKYHSLITPRAISQRFGALATVPKTNRK